MPVRPAYALLWPNLAPAFDSNVLSLSSPLAPDAFALLFLLVEEAKISFLPAAPQRLSVPPPHLPYSVPGRRNYPFAAPAFPTLTHPFFQPHHAAHGTQDLISPFSPPTSHAPTHPAYPPIHPAWKPCCERAVAVADTQQRPLLAFILSTAPSPCVSAYHPFHFHLLLALALSYPV